jgi:hypothetical protein
MGTKGCKMSRKENQKKGTSYLHEGEIREIQPVYDQLHVGQQVVLYQATMDKGHPLAKYEQPAVFTVVSWSSNATNFYNPLVLRDDEGREVNTIGWSAMSLYDLAEWSLFQYWRLQEMLNRKTVKINQQDSQISMLKDVLKAPSVRIVTAEQAKDLGIS